MSAENNLDIGNAYKTYFTPPTFTSASGTKSHLPFKAALSKENGVAALKYLSFFSLVTPFAFGLAHIASKLHQSARYGFEVVAFQEILPSQVMYKRSALKATIDKSQKECEPSFDSCKRTFEAQDGVKLEGAYLPGKTPEGENVKQSEKTMIYFVGNGEHFATELNSPLMNTFRENGYNILLFNYRGVGESTGHATRDGLFSDGETVFQHVCDLGVAENDILLFGHSIGAGIASQVALNHKEVKFCHERSFVSLDKAAEDILGGMAGRVAGAAIRSLGINIESTAGFEAVSEGNRLAVFDPDDQMITSKSSLHTYLRSEARDNFEDSIKLNKGDRSDPHNRWLTKGEAELIYCHFHPLF